MKLTVTVLHCIRLLFYIPRQLSTSNFSSILPMQPVTGQIITLKNVFTWNLETKITPSVNWLPLFMTPFRQPVCLFKTLVNQVAFNLAVYWLPGKFKGNLCTAVTLYITVTWPFTNGDRYIQFWLYVPRSRKVKSELLAQQAFFMNFCCYIWVFQKALVNLISFWSVTYLGLQTGKVWANSIFQPWPSISLIFSGNYT